MRAFVCVLGALGLLSAGCAGPAGTPSASPVAATPAPTQAPVTPGPTPSSAGPARIELVGEAPVLRASVLDGDRYEHVLPGAYFIDGNVRHAYVVGFGRAPGDQRVFHATSPDGISWRIDPADPFADLGLDLSPPGPIASSILHTDGGWVMYLWGVPAPALEGSAIWRATAATPGGPWIADAQPVLPPGDTGAWDDRGLDFPSVVPTSDGYSMLYSANGGDRPSTARIGLATSSDGVNWLRGSGPVIDVGLCPFDAQYMAQPRLVAQPAGYTVLYNTDRRVGAGIASGDAVDWHCLSDEPLISGADVPGGQGIHTFAAAGSASGISVLLESLVSDASELWLGEIAGLD
jgi:hypothetical protein